MVKQFAFSVDIAMCLNPDVRLQERMQEDCCARDRCKASTTVVPEVACSHLALELLSTITSRSPNCRLSCADIQGVYLSDAINASLLHSTYQQEIRIRLPMSQLGHKLCRLPETPAALGVEPLKLRILAVCARPVRLYQACRQTAGRARDTHTRGSCRPAVTNILGYSVLVAPMLSTGEYDFM